MLHRVLRAVVDENVIQDDGHVLQFIYVGCVYGHGRVDFNHRHDLHLKGKSNSTFGKLAAACIKVPHALSPAVLKMIPVLADMWPQAALDMEAVLLTALAGKTLWQGCLNASGGGGMGSASADRTLAGASCGGKIGGPICQATHDANAASGQPSLYEFTSEDRSRGGTSRAHVQAVRADASKANFKCPRCSMLYFYATPRGKPNKKNPHGEKHSHCRCPGNDKKRVYLVPYPLG
jgi:hypothetical protein